MSQTIRHVALALLIAVSVSVAALGLHVASHDTGELQTCGLCSSKDDSAHAIPPAIVQIVSPELTYFICEPAFIVDIPVVRIHAQQRAPPITA